MWLASKKPSLSAGAFLFPQPIPSLPVYPVMTIKLVTKVPGNFRDIMRAFDRQLFEALAPPLAKMEIVEFTGSKKGDRVHIRFISPVKAEWISEITEDQETESQSWFVDKGTQLPWPLGYWEHKHIVRQVNETHSEIIDDIRFKGKNGFLSLLLYPAILFGFLPRKRIYKNYFSKQQT